MEEYIGLDVSMKETAVSIRRDGKRVWRGTCASDPKRHCQPDPKARTVGQTSGLRDRPLIGVVLSRTPRRGAPAICIDARHAKAALDMAANKTDANDADGLAHLAEVGFFREVRVKGFDSMLTRTLVAARNRLVKITTGLSNQIRGLMKTFGLLVPAGKGSTFEKNVRSLLVDQEGLAPIVLPMLEAWRSLRPGATNRERSTMMATFPAGVIASRRAQRLNAMRNRSGRCAEGPVEAGASNSGSASALSAPPLRLHANWRSRCMRCSRPARSVDDALC